MIFTDKIIQPIKFNDGELVLLDQRALPHDVRFIRYKSEIEVAKAIKDMVVRGAPAIGITAAYGMALSKNPWAAAEILKNARPTAVDLSNAIEYMIKEIKNGKDATVAAIEWHEKIIKSTKKISEYGASLLKNKAAVLLHCNAGPLATGGYGTSLGAVLKAGKSNDIMVYVDETRPRCQGSLTYYELSVAGVRHTVIVDSAAGFLLRKNKIGAVMVGADRIAKNGDVANKIGTYQLAVLAKENKVPFYVLAPLSTFDFSIDSGDDIKIEEREESEILQIAGQDIYKKGTTAYNPAFDVTPAKYITAYVTEYGVHNHISELLKMAGVK